MVVVGHGLRARQLRDVADGPPRTLTLHARRFRCRACRAVLVVVPRAVAAGRHFARRAIAMALGLFGLMGRSVDVIRNAVGGLGSDRRWRTLARWCDAVAVGSLFGLPPRGGPRREIACQASTRLMALVPAVPGVPELDRVMAGSERAP